MKDTDVHQRLVNFVRENFLYARESVELTPHTSLLEQGIIDSMGVVEIVGFVESEFGVKVRDEDITEENLGTIAAIGGYVLRVSQSAGNT